MPPLEPNPNEQLYYLLKYREIDDLRYKQDSVQRLLSFNQYTNDYIDGKCLVGLPIGQPTWANRSAKVTGVVYEPEQAIPRVGSVIIHTSAPPTPPVTIVLTYPYSWNTISTMMPTNFAAVVSGASSPLTFSIVTGSLPSGLNLNSSSGLVYGTASMLAWGTTGTIAIKVVDSNGDEDTSPTYSWAVN